MTMIDTSRRGLLGGAVLAGAVGAAIGSRPVAAQTSGRFAGKVVAITGATSGIGRVAAEAFAAEGARVAFCGRRTELGTEVANGIRARGGEAIYIPADVRDATQVQRFIDQTVDRYGRLDIAFNNAGIGQPFSAMATILPATHRDLYETNVMGKYYAMTAEVPHLERAGGGVIINTSSIFGIKAGANAVAYCGTQHAVTGLTMGAALELAPKGIRVVGVAPGAITDTDFMVPLIGRRLNAEEIASFGPLHALGRTGSAREVVRAVLWLASPEASFVTGEVMKVDGYFLQG